MNFRQLALLSSVSALAVLTACAGPARREARAERANEMVAVAPVPVAYTAVGQVQSIDIIPVATRTTSGGGALLGGILGGVIGNQFGAGMGKAVATGAGAVAGAVVGNNIEARRNRRDDEIYRVMVRFDDGSVRAIDFQRVDDLRVGDRVRWEQGQLYRM